MSLEILTKQGNPNPIEYRTSPPKDFYILKMELRIPLLKIIIAIV